MKTIEDEMKVFRTVLNNAYVAKIVTHSKRLNESIRPYLPLINTALLIACITTLFVSFGQNGRIVELTGEIYDLRYENDELRREISSVEDKAEEAVSKADEAQSDVDDLERKITFGTI